MRYINSRNFDVDIDNLTLTCEFIVLFRLLSQQIVHSWLISGSRGIPSSEGTQDSHCC